MIKRIFPKRFVAVVGRKAMVAGLVTSGWLALILAAPSISVIAQESKSPSREKSDELIVLNSLGGYGKSGTIQADRKIVPPKSRLGFSLQFRWEPEPDGTGFWHVGDLVLPPNVHVQDYDTFACDLYVKEADDKAGVSLYLVELDGDRWVCWNEPLAKVPHHRWLHIEVPRGKMKPWRTGDGTFQWSDVHALALEPSGGKSVFHVDNLCLLGPNGKRADFLTTADEPFPPVPEKPTPLSLPTPGVVYFPDLANPPNKGEFVRFRDGVAKALAFQQTRAEKPGRPASTILCIDERPPAKATNSLFFGLRQPHGLAQGLSDVHLVFDLRDSLDLEQVIHPYQVVVYAPMAPRVRDVELIRRWLDEKPGRTLVTHTFVPTRLTNEWWGGDRGAGLGRAQGGAVLGLGKITESDRTHCTVTSIAKGWKTSLRVGQALDFPSPLTRCEHGEPLVTTDAGPLVSRVKLERGQVVYLHYTAEDIRHPTVAAINRDVMKQIGKELNLAPVCEADRETSVQVFTVSGGHSVVVWDRPTLERWKFEYKPGIAPLDYAAPGVNRVVRVPLEGHGDRVVYDFNADRLEHVPATQEPVSLRLKDAVTGLYYVGLDTPKMQETIAKVRKVREKMRTLKFDAAP